MKNNLLITIVLCISTINVNATEKDSIQFVDVIDVNLDRGIDTLNTVKLVIRNLLNDSISINSIFFIDEYYKPCHILIYCCEYSKERDSIVCDWGRFYNPLEPNFINFSSERLIDMPPKGVISLEISLYNPLFDKGEVYFDVRFFCKSNSVSRFISKTTNKIYFERVKTPLEKYQEKLNQKRNEETYLVGDGTNSKNE